MPWETRSLLEARRRWVQAALGQVQSLAQLLPPSWREPQNRLQTVAPFPHLGDTRAAGSLVSAAPLADPHTRPLAGGHAPGVPQASDLGWQENLCLAAPQPVLDGLFSRTGGTSS